MQFELYGPKRQLRGRPEPVRDSLFITVREAQGLSLIINTPWYQWCEKIPEPEFRAWLENGEVLSREPRFRGAPEATEELIGGGLRQRGEAQRGVILADEISPDGLEAVHEILCLARTAFGSRMTNAALAITPELAARVGFPEACPPVPDGSSAASRTGASDRELGRAGGRLVPG